MKTKITFLTLTLFLVYSISYSQTVWTGPKTTFSKASNADWNLTQNQDKITDNVIITRKDVEGIFNIADETRYFRDVSPSDTEWAFGTTADYNTLTYNDWRSVTRRNPNGDHTDLPGQDMVVHLITDDIYIDLKFLSWGRDDGGSFSYERSTNQALSLEDNIVNKDLRIFPNPVKDVLSISKITPNTDVIIFNILGKKVLTTQTNYNSEINVKNLPKGLYLIRLKNNATGKFIKN